jgi:hypothetical protein
MNASSAGSEFARSARPKELIAVAARCDTTNLPQPLSIAAQEETLETPAWRPI